VPARDFLKPERRTCRTAAGAPPRTAGAGYGPSVVDFIADRRARGIAFWLRAPLAIEANLVARLRPLGRTAMTAKHWLLAAAAVVLGTAAADAASMKLAPTVVELKREAFQGTLDGKPVDLYTIRNKAGMTARITNYGAKIEQLLVPDRKGVFADVALGFDSLATLQKGQPSMGAFIGRYANRIGNAKFTLDGVEYALANNNNGASLHGGAKGTRFQVFSARQLSDSAVEMMYVFKDGEENYPGTLPVRVVYSISDKNELTLEWEATAVDKATVANFTGHTFFNLTGDPTVVNSKHVIKVNADAFLPVDKTLIPTGERKSVAGTPFDFRAGKPFGKDIGVADEQLKLGDGYDHHFVLNKSKPGAFEFASSAYEPDSGRYLEVWTTEPGIQIFSGNNLAAKDPIDAGKGGRKFIYRGAFCMEASRFPDGPNKPSFPSTVVKPGEWYTGKIVYKFATK
jgi:aldose 1-epimerase